jgi:FkbM family methyltransferase
MPKLHQIAFWYAWNGFRSSQKVWKLVRLIDRNKTPLVVSLPNGFPIIVNDLDWISKTVYEGTYERSLLHFLRSLVLTDTIIDIGANIGATLWHSLYNCPQQADYMAFEPSSQCSEGLNLTVSKTFQKGVVYSFAVGSTNEVTKIFGVNNVKHSGSASLIRHSGLSESSGLTQVKTLDSVLSEFDHLPSVSLLKIDTEGFEAHVVRGAGTLLGNQKVEILVMEVSPNFGSVEYLRKVNEFLGDNYRWLFLDEIGFLKRRPKLRTISLTQALDLSSQWNLVVIRSDVYAKHRINGNKYFKSISRDS